MILQLSLMDEAGELEILAFKNHAAERYRYMKVTPNDEMRTFIDLYWKGAQQKTCDYFFQLAQNIEPYPKLQTLDACYKALCTYRRQTGLMQMPCADVVQYLSLRVSRKQLRSYLWELHQSRKIHLNCGERDGYQRVQIRSRGVTTISLVSDLARSRSRSSNVDHIVDRSWITPINS